MNGVRDRLRGKWRFTATTRSRKSTDKGEGMGMLLHPSTRQPLTRRNPPGTGSSKLHFGAERKGSQALREKVERALRNIEILPYNSDCSQSCGMIRAVFEREGRGIGPNGLLIRSPLTRIFQGRA